MSPLPSLTLRHRRMLQTRAWRLGLCAVAKGVSREPLSGLHSQLAHGTFLLKPLDPKSTGGWGGCLGEGDGVTEEESFGGRVLSYWKKPLSVPPRAGQPLGWGSPSGT